MNFQAAVTKPNEPSKSSASFALDLRAVSTRILAGEDLSREESFTLLDTMLDGKASDIQIASVLTALAAKGESVNELVGMAEAMRARMIRVQCSHDLIIDTAGTGAGKTKTFNVSTAAAFVIAAAGLPIAKHGARAATSNTGSADVLKALGLSIEMPVALSERTLQEQGICFLFAPMYHPAAARVAHIRRELRFRTIFNLIGPLCNPASAPLQVMGVGDASLIPRISAALAALGTRRAWVVCGEDGLDEISLAAPTKIAEVRDGHVSEMTVSPEDFGITKTSFSHLRIENPEASAEITLEVLKGTADRCAIDLVTLNAAAALVVGLELLPKEAVQRAREALRSGAALAKLEALRAIGQQEQS